MTDARTPQQRGGLDEAIDRTVRALMDRRAPETLRARVMAQLSERPTARAWPRWTPQRLAWAGAAVAIIVAVVLVAPRWRARPDVPASRTTTADLTPARPAAPSVPSASAVAPTSVVAQATPAGPEAVRSPRAARPAGADTSLAWRAERPPFIDPLPAPEPIAIGALETERIAAEGVDIEPLTLDALRIEPIHVQR